MTYPLYVREKARQLRIEKCLSVDEIAARLALPKTTVYYWVRDLPLGRERRSSPGQRKGNGAMQNKYHLLREAAYARGLAQYDELVLLPTFRDFVVLYIAEGYKRCRNTVSISNSDPGVVTMAAAWLWRLAGKPPIVRVQHHADQDVGLLRKFWATTIGVRPDAIRFFPKTNSGQLRTRVWRCTYGVAALDVYNTLLRARVQAWMDRVRQEWTVDSDPSLGA